MPEPGTLYRLKPGEEIEFAEPKTSTQFEPVAINTLQAMAVGVGLTYDVVTGDFARPTTRACARARSGCAAWSSRSSTRR
jgi:capsid protein